MTEIFKELNIAGLKNQEELKAFNEAEAKRKQELHERKLAALDKIEAWMGKQLKGSKKERKRMRKELKK